VSYFHIELDTHDIVYAEGAAAESFVEPNDRAIFHNSDEFALLYPGETSVACAYCEPRVEEGEKLDEIRRKLALRLAQLGLTMTPDPDLHLVADGCVVLPETVTEGVY